MISSVGLLDVSASCQNATSEAITASAVAPRSRRLGQALSLPPKQRFAKILSSLLDVDAVVHRRESGNVRIGDTFRALLPHEPGRAVHDEQPLAVATRNEQALIQRRGDESVARLHRLTD